MGQVPAQDRRPAASQGGRSGRDFGFAAAATVAGLGTHRLHSDFQGTVGADTELHLVQVTDLQTRRVNVQQCGEVNRGWLDMDRVDPCQPTQAYNVGSIMMQDSNLNWT